MERIKIGLVPRLCGVAAADVAMLALHGWVIRSAMDLVMLLMCCFGLFTLMVGTGLYLSWLAAGQLRARPRTTGEKCRCGLTLLLLTAHAGALVWGLLQVRQFLQPITI